MRKKRGSFLSKIITISFIVCISCADVGVFIKAFSLNDHIKFKSEEKVSIIDEVNNTYTIEKGSNIYKVPKECVLKVSESKHKYKVSEDLTCMLKKPNKASNVIRKLKKGEILYLHELKQDFGYFESDDSTEGYVLLEHLEKIDNSHEKDVMTKGISNVSKVIKGKENYYVLKRGQKVFIKNYTNNHFVLVDEEGNEFKVPSNYINLGNKKTVLASRSMYGTTKKSDLSKVITTAYSLIGSPYVSGDTGKRGYDCSGFTYCVYKNSLGIELPRSSSSQVRSGVSVNRSELMPGDLLFFNTSGRGISHVGIYIGEEKMIHASSSSRKIEIANINSSYYINKYVTARRIVNK